KREEEERIRAEKARAAEKSNKNKTISQSGVAGSNNSTTSNNVNTPNPPQSGGLLQKPVNYPINSPYRPSHRPNHKGVDMAAAKGTAVVAAESGYVTRVVTGCGEGKQYHSCGGGFGNVVYITHLVQGRTITTVYAHLSSVNVTNGQTVSRGQ